MMMVVDKYIVSSYLCKYYFYKENSENLLEVGKSMLNISTFS